MTAPTITRWLYLDYDGVLHPDPVYLTDRGEPELRHMTGHLFMYQDRLAEALAPHPDVRIILSTTWAVRLGLERAKSYLREDLRSRVIGQSGPLRMRQQQTRAREVEMHVREHLPDRWVILDDDPYLWDRSSIDHLVLCDSERGLGDDAALERLEVLLAASKL
jgi:hypothetical protein